MDADADVEPVPELEFDQTLGWYSCGSNGTRGAA